MQGLSRPLRLAPIALQALVRSLAAALASLGVLLAYRFARDMAISFGPGPALYFGSKETLSHPVSGCKPKIDKALLS